MRPVRSLISEQIIRLGTDAGIGSGDGSCFIAIAREINRIEWRA